MPVKSDFSYRELLLKSMRQKMIGYMKDKILLEDWHAVSDSACDLREIDAELRGISRTDKQEIENVT